MVRLLVLGNPENRRIELLKRSAERYHVDVDVLSYQKILEHPSVEQFAKSLDADWDAVRVDSPGENFQVEKLLIERGAKQPRIDGLGWLSPEDARCLKEENGRIHFPYLYYLGFSSLLKELEVSLPQGLHWLNSSDAVNCMFDKPSCSKAMLNLGVPVARQYGQVRSFQELESLGKTHRPKRIFLKIANGSSASGLVALRVRSEEMTAVSTVEIAVEADRTKLYNNLQLRHYRNRDEVERLVGLLAPHRIYAEDWLQKAQWDHRRTFDLRVVVINGKPTHYVPRVSDSPFTNLHLGNARGDLRLFQERLAALDDDLRDVCQKVHGLLDSAFCIGLDVLITPGFRKCFVLEANACGDLLPGIVDHEGRSTHDVQMLALSTMF